MPSSLPISRQWSQETQDDLTDVNAQELDLFQSLAEAVQYSEKRVQAIQWAADEELKQWTMPSLKQVLLSWLG